MSFKIKKALSYVLISSTCLMSFTFAQIAEARTKSHKKYTHHRNIHNIYYKKHVVKANRGHYKRANYNDDLNNEPLIDNAGQLKLRSGSALVVNQRLNQTLYSKNPEVRTPIASITKLMTAMVVLDGNLDLNEPITIEDADVDTLKNSSSRLKVGTTLTRADTLRLALMSSENRAAAALARTYPGGKRAFFNAMNRKAMSLNMTHTRFVDSTGLDSRNISTAFDLAKMVDTAYRYPVIREYSTSTESLVYVPGKPTPIPYHNTNGLVGSKEWSINVSKTGYINEAGRCLVMQAVVNNEPVIIVLLDSVGKYSRIGDANRVKQWLEQGGAYQKPNPNVPNINVKNTPKTKYGQRAVGHSPS